MTLTQWGLLAALALAAAQVPAEEATRWSEGSLQARLVQAGYERDLKTGTWKAMVELRFLNSALDRRYNQSLQLQFLSADGKQLGAWKTFLSLPPGEAQHRQVQAPARLACSGDLAVCPPLSVRLALSGGKALDPPAPIPLRPLEEEGAPAIGTPLYVVRVLDATTFQLLSGQKVRLAGLAAPANPLPGLKPDANSGAAVALLRQRVMGGPVTLTFDGEHRDPQGRWLALVRDEEGGSINTEMLQKGLAKADTATKP